MNGAPLQSTAIWLNVALSAEAVMLARDSDDVRSDWVFSEGMGAI